MAVDPGTRFERSGKVRDLYALSDERLLLVASDRISAFDVVLPTPIPDKGRVLTGLSRHWFRETAAAGIVGNHLLATDPAEVPTAVTASDDSTWGEGLTPAALRGRMMICRRARPLPVEIIVRGYLSGSGWKDYQRSGRVCGIPLSSGMGESERLPQPLFTPSTKAEVGHDENIDFDTMVSLVGPTVAEEARRIALALYAFGTARAEAAGIILADTKYELGLVDEPGGESELILIDEVMTPDSSRFWDAESWEPGRPQPSFDKQFVRDWLETQAWDKTDPGPNLPPAVVEGTRSRYVEAFERICGLPFARYLTDDRID